MSIATVLPFPLPTFVDDDGHPVGGGQLYSYIAGTDTPQATYADALLTVPNTNPLVLNAAGRPDNPIYLLTTPAYKFTLLTADLAFVWSADNIIADAPAS